MDDMYLSLATELYENGTWSKDVLVRKVTLYAQEKKMDMNAISEFLDRLTKTKEYTIDEKRKFLSVLRLDGKELKYGDVADTMTDEMVQKFYEMEVATLDSDKIESYHDLANFKSDSNVSQEEKENKQNEDVELVQKNDTVGNITINDIVSGNFNSDDLLGKNSDDSDALFDKLVNGVNKDSFEGVVVSLTTKMGPLYARRFVEEWSKGHSLDEETQNKELSNSESIENKQEKPLIPAKPEIEKLNIPEAPKIPAPGSENKSEKVEPDVEENVNKATVVPKIPFDLAGEDMPETEEEFQEQAKKITSPEKESSVKKVFASPDRIEKLKKTKGKAINFFLKTAIVVTAVSFLHPVYSIAAIGGYLYFASEIKNGKFNPENSAGKAVKKVVETIMNIGLPKDKDKEKEGGKTR